MLSYACTDCDRTSKRIVHGGRPENLILDIFWRSQHRSLVSIGTFQATPSDSLSYVNSNGEAVTRTARIRAIGASWQRLVLAWEHASFDVCWGPNKHVNDRDRAVVNTVHFRPNNFEMFTVVPEVLMDNICISATQWEAIWVKHMFYHVLRWSKSCLKCFLCVSCLMLIHVVGSSWFNPSRSNHQESSSLDHIVGSSWFIWFPIGFPTIFPTGFPLISHCLNHFEAFLFPGVAAVLFAQHFERRGGVRHDHGACSSAWRKKAAAQMPRASKGHDVCKGLQGNYIYKLIDIYRLKCD